MLPDFQILSGAPKPNAFYSRHLSLNDVRAQKEDTNFNLSQQRRTSSQPLCNRTNTALNEKEIQALDNFEALKNSRKKAAKKVAQKQQKEEDIADLPCATNSKEKSSLKGCRASDFDFKNTENLDNMDELENTRDVYETADADGTKWCQCSKQNAKFSSQPARRKSQRAKTLKRNMMGTLVEEVPTETKCGICFLEIRDESKRKERIIELWMQFFG